GSLPRHEEGYPDGRGSRRAPFFDGRERFTEHILKRQPFVFPSVKRPALGNLTHKRRIAEYIQRFLEASVLIDIDQNGSRTAILRHDHFLLPLLPTRHKLRQAGFHLR